VAIGAAAALEQLIGAAGNHVLYFVLSVKQNISGNKLHWCSGFAPQRC
jgi:hypothetical protein